MDKFVRSSQQPGQPLGAANVRGREVNALDDLPCKGCKTVVVSKPLSNVVHSASKRIYTSATPSGMMLLSQMREKREISSQHYPSPSLLFCSTDQGKDRQAL